MAIVSDFSVLNVLDSENDKIMPKKGWSLRFIKVSTQEKYGFCLDNLYDYDIFNKRCKNQLIKNLDIDDPETISLDEFMWETFTTYLEECRQLVFDTYKENGVNACESYFLSLKFLFSTLKKFRSKFYRELDSREDYDKTPLKIAVNYLMFRVKSIMASEKYRFSRISE